MSQLRKQRGVVAIIVALMLIVFCGFLGLAIDLSYSYLKRTQLQAAADAEALACVIQSGTTCPVSTSVASTDFFPNLTTQYNFTNKFTVSTYNPGDDSVCPSGAGVSKCVRVIMTDTWNAFYIPVFGFKNMSNTVVAIAGRQGQGVGCVIASTLFTASGSQGLNGSSCVNYFGNVSVNGNPPITGTTNYIYNGNSPGSCSTCSPPAITQSGTLTAPALGGTIYKPTTPGTLSGGFTGSVAGTITCPKKTTCTLSPGIYNSIDCSNSQAVCNLVPTGSAPSQYTFEFDGNVIGPANNGSMTGTGVVLYFGGSGAVTMGGGGAMTFSAPQTGVCSGSVTPVTSTVFYGPNVTGFNYGGGSALTLTGNIYMPNALFTLSGNGGINMAGTMVTNTYSDSGGGNSGLTVTGSNSCGFSPNGSGRAVLAQ